MDRGRMDADRGRAVRRDRRGRKLAMVVAAQNVLVAACLVVTLYVYWDGHGLKPDNVHIHFEPISDISGNMTLQFSNIHSSNMMSLVGKNNDTIYVNCSGPYVLYMHVCYKSMNQEDSQGTLQLHVEAGAGGSTSPVSSFDLSASHIVCRRLHSIAFLKAKERASLHLYSASGFKVKTVTVGLSYLLAGECY